MKGTFLDEKWTYRKGYLDSITMLDSDPGETVNLPHDGMIGTEVSKDAPAGSDSGFFTGGLSNYTKNIYFPEEWKEGYTGLRFDGVMMNATLDVNGSRVAQCHYGYAPFFVDLSDHVTFGKENRITVNVNTSMQPASRWYTGSGIYRSVSLMHGPRVHIVPDGIFVYTKDIADGYAFLEAVIDVENTGNSNRMAEVVISLYPEGSSNASAETKRVIKVSHGKTVQARMQIIVKDPLLWDADHPQLYTAKAVVTDIGEYRTHFEEDEKKTTDEASVLFGIRTVSADPVRGLLINGKSVKLKGGCLHHDNGLLGSVTMTSCEERKIRKLKEAGFNAVRTAHNPPSAALIECCDRLGMYVFDEAFDAWFIGKRGGDYHQFFEADWKKDLTAFVRRDRSHPSVIMWSTGNEIPERGGLGSGYERATELAETIRSLDGTRPVSNGICSFWSGLDDSLAVGWNHAQNSGDGFKTTLWETASEPFTNGLDVVGYNYMEEIYERDHEMYPERVILGSENFPKEIGFRWPMVEKLSYVIGDFTWTAWDYIGEAGIGKAAYVDPEDPKAPKNPWDLMPPATSPYPWRLANDADFDITGNIMPQGEYRSIVWGSGKTKLYSLHPDTYGKKEIVSMWGFPYVLSNWTYPGYEGKNIELVVFSAAEEVEVLVNGKSIGRKNVCMEKPMPYTARFETVYESGEVIAIGFKDGKEISRDTLITAGAPAFLKITPDKTQMRADGHDLIYAQIDVCDKDGHTVPDAEIALKASVNGAGILAGFGSSAPVTDENYTDDDAVTYRGRAMLIIRSGYDAGDCEVTVSTKDIGDAKLKTLLICSM